MLYEQSRGSIQGEVVCGAQSILGSLSACGLGEANKEEVPSGKITGTGRPNLTPPALLHPPRGSGMCVLPTEPSGQQVITAQREISIWKKTSQQEAI